MKMVVFWDQCPVNGGSISETSINFYGTTWRSPEDGHLHSPPREPEILIVKINPRASLPGITFRNCPIKVLPDEVLKNVEAKVYEKMGETRRNSLKLMLHGAE
jgi:hypothetical protein